VVTRVSPKRGPLKGGTQVTITGSEFSGTTEVEFGGRAASFHVDSGTSISAEAPAGTGLPHGKRTVAITVITPDGPSKTTARGRFHYLKQELAAT
jgi:large repetitive protein